MVEVGMMEVGMMENLVLDGVLDRMDEIFFLFWMDLASGDGF